MSANHVSLRRSHKFPGQWERWESDDGKSWRMVAMEYPSQEAMRAGPRSYTPEQAEVIARAVKERQPLSAPALPIEQEEKKDPRP